MLKPSASIDAVRASPHPTSDAGTNDASVNLLPPEAIKSKRLEELEAFFLIEYP